MTQYRKLFDKSEIEYITPFLKLWMSFNNWYKKDLDGVRIKVRDAEGNIKTNPDGSDKEKDLKTDREAINEYKEQGAIKNEFIRLLNGRSNEDEKFQNALALFVKDVDECNFENFDYPNNLFSRNPAERTIQNNSLVFISSQYKEFYFTSGDENRLYENTLEMIYQIRCKLVHGNFDIEDQLFINLVEKSYLILYPIMNRILQIED